MRDKRPNGIGRAKRYPAFLLDAGRQSTSTSGAPPFQSATVANKKKEYRSVTIGSASLSSAVGCHTARLKP